MQQETRLALNTPCICFRVRKASRALTRIYDEALAATGLTVTQFSMLRNAIRLGRPTLNELATATGHERSALWRTLQPLVREGLMTLAADKGQRADRVSVTVAGRQAVEAALPAWQACQSQVRARLGSESEQTLLRMLKAMESLAG